MNLKKNKGKINIIDIKRRYIMKNSESKLSKEQNPKNKKKLKVIEKKWKMISRKVQELNWK